MSRDLPELGFEFEKLERFNLETAAGGALKKNIFVKNYKIHIKTSVLQSPF